MTDDLWLEELAANALAVAYCREFEQVALSRGLELARAVRERPQNELSSDGEAVLRHLFEAVGEPRTGLGYGMDLQQMAVVQLALIERLAERPEPLADVVQRYLRPAA